MALARDLVPFMRAVLGAVVGFALVTAAGLALVSGLARPSPWQLLAMRGNGGERSIATVLSIDRADHNTCRYRFVARERVVTRSQSCSASAPGARLPVYFLRSDPSVSTTDDPQTQAVELLILPAVVGLFAAALVGGLIWLFSN